MKLYTKEKELNIVFGNDEFKVTDYTLSCTPDQGSMLLSHFPDLFSREPTKEYLEAMGLRRRRKEAKRT